MSTTPPLQPHPALLADTSGPRMVLGMANFGSRTDESTSFALMDRFVDAGGVWFDTANCYAYWHGPERRGGQSESVLGRWLRARPGRREQIKISTKVGCELAPTPEDPDATEGLAPATIRSGLAASLDRLNTDRVELFWAHRDDRDVPQDETVAAFGDTIADGTVGQWGYSNAPLWRVERARGLASARGTIPPTALQLRYSYVQPRPLVRDHIHDHRFGWVTDEVLDYASAHPEVALWSYSPLLSGAYDRADRSLSPAFDHPGTTRRLEVLASVADRLGLTRSQVVAAWLAGGSPSVVPIIGVSTLDQLDQAVLGTGTRLADAVRAELDEPW